VYARAERVEKDFALLATKSLGLGTEGGTEAAR
jgi:hypothetical protein